MVKDFGGGGHYSIVNLIINHSSRLVSARDQNNLKRLFFSFKMAGTECDRCPHPLLLRGLFGEYQADRPPCFRRQRFTLLLELLQEQTWDPPLPAGYVELYWAHDKTGVLFPCETVLAKLNLYQQANSSSITGLHICSIFVTMLQQCLFLKNILKIINHMT